MSKLRAGETTFADEQTEGRSKSLGASLSYGFTTAFTEDERKILALLHFFQGFVDVKALRIMGGDPTVIPTRNDWYLPEVRALTREIGINLLDHAAEVGLLTSHGGGYYSIHPALPWYFKSLFDQYYPDEALSLQPSAESGQSSVVSGLHPLSLILLPSAVRAFVEAMGELGNYYTAQYIDGNRDVIAALEREEDNLLHARRLARLHGWWSAVISTMQGLRVLYDHTGRRAEWQALVAEIVPDFVDPTTDGPLPSREEQWGLVTEYRVRLAMEARQWADAERLQRARVEWTRHRAAPFLTDLPSPPVSPTGRNGWPQAAGEGTGSEGEISAAARNTLRSLAVSIELLGHILREQGKAECITQYQEAVDISERMNDREGAAVTAFNLGHAHKDIPALRDLDQAERWYRRILDFVNTNDGLGLGKGYYCLGHVAYERFKDARASQQPEPELVQHLNTAVGFYQQALQLLPPNAVDDLAVAQGQLGIIYAEANDFENAIPHWREAIRYNELGGNLYEAGRQRRNVAIGLANAGRWNDALLYAQAALRNFATYGDRAADKLQETQGLIAWIEAAMKK